MQISKQTQNTLTLVLSIIIAVSMITLLYITIAVPDANSPPQAVVGGPVVEPAETLPQPPVIAAAESPQTVPEVQAEEPAAQVQQPENVQSDTVLEAAEPKAESKNNPFLIVVIAVVSIGGGTCAAIGIIKILKNRFNNEDVDDSEQTEEPRSFILAKLFNRNREPSPETQEETDDLDEFQGDDEVLFEEGRGYCFIPPPIKSEAEEPDEPEYIPELSGPDESAADSSTLPEEDPQPERPTTDYELKLCREIERLSDKSNQLKDYIEDNIIAINPDLGISLELIESEEYDELPAGADELRQEVERLKNKINLQIDYIEKSEKKQGDNANNPDNNNEKEPFLVCVANALSNMQKNGLVYKPKRQRENQEFTYVPSAELFDNLSMTLPDYKKKNALEALKQHGIINNTEYDTVYNKKRVLKVNSKQFELLITEIAQDVGA